MSGKKELDRYKWNYTKEIRKGIKPGALILSQPFLDDEVFKRSVCLLCAHSRSEGSFGFIINKISHYELGDFFEEMEHLPFKVYYGGPVATDSLYFLHDNSLNIKDAMRIKGDLYWGGDFDDLRTKLMNRNDDYGRLKFIIGYSGWDPEQLKKEIIEDTWVVNNDFDRNLIYSDDTEALWKNIMEDMGDLYKHMSGLPESPSLN